MSSSFAFPAMIFSVILGQFTNIYVWYALQFQLVIRYYHHKKETSRSRVRTAQDAMRSVNYPIVLSDLYTAESSLQTII